MRHGFSLLELLLCAAILAVSLFSIFGVLSTNRKEYLHADDIFVGRMLAQSVMDQACHRFYNSQTRFYDASTPLTVIQQGLATNAWQAPFLALAQSKIPVITATAFGAAPPNSYFNVSNGPVVPASPDEIQFLSAYAYEVDVGFDLTSVLGKNPVSLDADGDGIGETDLGRVDVLVYFTPPDHSSGSRQIARLTTILMAPGKTPGIAAFSPAN